MKALSIASALFVAVAVRTTAATLYVNLNSTNPVPPYAGWSTAATNIQDAVDASTNGDLVLVTNGVYAIGGRTVNGYALTNRVVLDKPVNLQSVNGPTVTSIQGFQVPTTTNGSNAVRCVYMTNGAALIGFSLTNGATLYSGDKTNEQSGGGLWCESVSETISNCAFTSDSANWFGGAAFQGTLNNCTVISNTAPHGGGVAFGVANNSVISGNSTGLAGTGGGAYSNVLNNCVLENNYTAGSGSAYGCASINCTIVSNSAGPAGSGIAGVYGGGASNCIIYYNSSYNSQPNFSATSLYYCCTTPAPPTFSFHGGDITNEPMFVNLTAEDFHLQSNSPCINAGTNAYVTSLTDLDGNARIVNGVVDMGAYEYQGHVRYVSRSSTNPIAPYSDWSIAATNIQDAVESSINGDLILVTNGVYQTGGRPAPDGQLTSVVVSNAVTLESVNGQTVTSIDGAHSMRCIYLTDGAVLSGFTLTNGYATIGAGGGAYCVSTDVLFLNCLVISNSAYQDGGVIYGTLENCTLSFNNSLVQSGGGAGRCVLNNCVLSNNRAKGNGGGASDLSFLNGCVLIGNYATRGGGVDNSTLNNCLVVSNTSPSGSGPTPYTGAAYDCALNNCTVVRNSGGGIVNDGTISPLFRVTYNCIAYYNTNGPDFQIWYPITNSCSPSLPVVAGNITNEPLFVNLAGGDFHLQSNSPCINSGNNVSVTSATDLDGNPRIVGGTIDIGAYEYQTPTSVISYAWLQQYGLPTDGTADYADSDGDGMNNYKEWIAGTNPTNALSVLEMLSPVPTNNPAGLFVSWQSANNRTYYLQSSTNLAAHPPFTTIQSNIVGLVGTASYTDTNAVGPGPYFYRVGVQ